MKNKKNKAEIPMNKKIICSNNIFLSGVYNFVDFISAKTLFLANP